ncbi:MAG: hypothetical protein QXS38_00835 [Candidatus Pacearchaeota archaeon]
MKYSFQSLIKQPTAIPYLIAGKDAGKFVADFERLVDKDYNGNRNLKVLRVADVRETPTVVGSNTLILPLVQKLVYPKRVGRPEDLQMTLNDGDTIGIRGNHYVDLGAVLDFSGYNHDLAVDLFEQLPKNLRNLDKMPSVVLGYDLKNSDKGRFGVGLTYTDGTEVRHSPILAKDSGNFSNEDVSLETGLPLKLEGGKRTLLTVSQKAPSKDNLGLSWLYLNRYLSLVSRYIDDDLADSYEDGRVVLF